MKTILATAAVLALTAALSNPAAAHHAAEPTAAEKSGGQCAISQAIMQAAADGEHQRMAETKSKIDLLIEGALAASRSANLAQSPVKLGKGSPDG